MVREGLTVACVLWQGEFRKRSYGPEWVRRLRNMVARNLDREHRFLCLSNVQVDGVETKPLRASLPGWWAKLELFREPLDDRVLYLDLDTIITGNLAPIVDYASDFALMPPSYTLTGGKPAGGKGVVDRYNSSCMVWTGDEPFRLWPLFHQYITADFRGDQDFIGYVEPDRDTLPAEWFSKLKDCQDGPRENTRVVLSMPWKNPDAAKRFAWVNEIWR